MLVGVGVETGFASISASGEVPQAVSTRHARATGPKIRDDGEPNMSFTELHINSCIKEG